MQYTKGPWKFRLYATDDTPAELAKFGIKPVRMLDNSGAMAISSEGGRIAMVDCQAAYKRGQGHATECAERDANARLIAASPDLFEALRDVMREMVHPGRVSNTTTMRALEAIGKAVGPKASAEARSAVANTKP